MPFLCLLAMKPPPFAFFLFALTNVWTSNAKPFGESIITSEIKFLFKLINRYFTQEIESVISQGLKVNIIGDLNSRRGQVGGMDSRGNARVIDAMVPLANMFGYVNNLRSMSQGRAQFTMQFDHYEQVPQAVADEVKAKLA